MRNSQTARRTGQIDTKPGFRAKGSGSLLRLKRLKQINALPSRV
jgi:hypothetical protein